MYTQSDKVNHQIRICIRCSLFKARPLETLVYLLFLRVCNPCQGPWQSVSQRNPWAICLRNKHKQERQRHQRCKNYEYCLEDQKYKSHKCQDCSLMVFSNVIVIVFVNVIVFLLFIDQWSSHVSSSILIKCLKGGVTERHL